MHLTQIVDIDAGAEASARRRGHEYFHGSIDEFAAPDRYDVTVSGGALNVDITSR